MKFWPIGRFLNWLSRQPPFHAIFGSFFGKKHNHAIIIPVHQVVQGTESVVLPRLLLSPLVEMASDRYILDQCVCRQAERCQNFPLDIGCLFLGKGAARIHPSLGRTVSPAEAKAHIDRAISAGLVPLIVHTAFDAYMLGIPFDQMLAVCFCCDCCCTVRSGLRMGPPAFWDAVERLPGLSVLVNEDCMGCGACVDVCHVHAISLTSGTAVINDLCKGCGRCSEACSAGAIQVNIQDISGMSEFVRRRIEQRTDIAGNRS